jgi:hypothetical protein
MEIKLFPNISCYAKDVSRRWYLPDISRFSSQAFPRLVKTFPSELVCRVATFQGRQVFLHMWNGLQLVQCWMLADEVLVCGI